MSNERDGVKYDAVILGSGMSGLSSALILAKEGKRVLVLEQHYRAGGYLHRFFRPGGLAFDVGFHYFGAVEQGQVLGSYFKYLGVLDKIKLIPLDPEGYDELHYPGFNFTIPAGEERYKEVLKKRFPSDIQGIDRYFDDLERIVAGFAFYRLKTEQDLGHADKWMSISLKSYLDTLTQNQDLQLALMGQNPLYGVEPSRTPVGLHALVTDSFMQNPYAIQGGGDALIQAMVERIQEEGGEVRTSKRVTQLHVDENRQIKAVQTEDGELFHTELVVGAIHPKSIIAMLPEKALRPGYKRRLSEMEDGIGTLSIFMTTKADLSSYASRNIYNYKTRDLDSLYTHPDSAGQFIFTTVPTAREGVGKSGLHQVIGLGVMPWDHVKKWSDTKSGKRGADYLAFKEETGQKSSELITEVIPELRGNIESIEIATPLTNRDYTGSAGGAAYGIHHSVEQSGRYGLRPRMKVGGLYMTGQSVLMPGVCGVTISAFHTSSIILGSDYLMGKVHAANE
ncbi:NAD(P)/FAD-dependent oxidoreductase [Myxococcota bacterium]|nr:NAD(P)/FAD-dependent oxidoreductase [Myxococcota bacterium]